MKKLKRALYLIHRWFGVALCLVFALWFASGLIMMYVEYPELTEEERTLFLPPLNVSDIHIDIEALQNILPADKTLSQLSLSSLLGRPVYQARFIGLPTITVFADTGTLFSGSSIKQVEQSAREFSRSGLQPTYMEQIEMDQWTVSSALDPHRPLHKVALNDAENSIVYVSSLTGQIVRDTNGWERAWNWAGSTIHWIYPMQLRRHPGVWTNVIIYVSLLGLVSVVSGTIVGFLRLRLKKRYKSGAITPYRGVQKWHHLLGLACVIFVATFLVSGLFSMNPWGIFDNKVSAAEQIRRYQGDNYSLNGLQSALDDLRSSPGVEDIKELYWHNIAGKGLLIANSPGGGRVVNMPEPTLQNIIRSAIPQLIPGQLSYFKTLNRFDSYYYSTHNRYRPLPVYRAVFKDSEATWFHVNANTGELLGRSTSTDRVERWLYNGLHSLDFRFLLDYRPLWDIVVILLSLAGLIFCWTSIVIGWRRLNFSLTKRLR